MLTISRQAHRAIFGMRIRLVGAEWVAERRAAWDAQRALDRAEWERLNGISVKSGASTPITVLPKFADAEEELEDLEKRVAANRAADKAAFEAEYTRLCGKRL